VLPPVRCFTCGAPLGHLWEEFQRRVRAGEDPAKVLDDLGVKRYCCRRTLLTSITYVEEMALYHVIRMKAARQALGGAELGVEEA
jgi:DNA-directed RNA polymerase subunit N